MSDALQADAAPAQPPRQVIGRPFQRGHDPRRGVRKMDETARALARARRRPVIEALVKMVETHCTSTSPQVLEQVRETAALILRYSDGEPGERNIPTELDERRAADAAPGGDELDGTEPPAVDGADAPQESAA